MERLVMYAQSEYGANFCLGKEWGKVKSTLHGKVDYMVFEMNHCSAGSKIRDCLEGKASPIAGGHLCLK